MTDVSKPDWVLRRTGSAHEVLTEDGTWGTLEHARWFTSYDEANAVDVPRGTTGTPSQQHPDAVE